MQANATVSELRFKAGRHDELSEMTRKLAEGLQHMKDEHSKTNAALVSKEEELEWCAEKEQHDKLLHQEANSPRKLQIETGVR